MKTKIKLKICYTAIQIKDIQSYPNVYYIKEVFTFDIKNYVTTFIAICFFVRFRHSSKIKAI